MPLKSVLALEDGTVIHSGGFGAEKLVSGEVVFNTSMSGYQEALTDPSYNGQILLLTYPLIGNYATNSVDMESQKIHAEGFIVREVCEKPEHPLAENSLDEFLRQHDIPGICEVDTRYLTRKIRIHGVMSGAIQTYSDDYIGNEELLRLAREQPERDLVLEVSSKKPRVFRAKKEKCHIVLLDCGTKYNIIRYLNAGGARVTLLPADYPAKKVQDLEPDGFLISNGPGDPAKATYAIETTKKVLDEQIETMGICFGHQILALAAGGRTYKLKFGHRGSNHPVKCLESNKIFITSQNHGYAVDEHSLEGTEFFVSEKNLNDGTVEGLSSRELPAFSVQYHPEGSPGPRDTEYLFDKFINSIR